VEKSEWTVVSPSYLRGNIYYMHNACECIYNSSVLVQKKNYNLCIKTSLKRVTTVVLELNPVYTTDYTQTLTKL